jgi:hypothetical protein
VTIESDSRLAIIGEWAFRACHSLTSFVIPRAVKEIRRSAFAECTRLATVAFESFCQCAVIGEEAFMQCSSLTCISVPASVERLEIACFAECGALARVDFESPGRLRVIDRRAFGNCIALTSCVLPRSLCALRDNAFCQCTALVQVALEEGACLHRPGDPFAECIALQEVLVPAALDREWRECADSLHPSVRHFNFPIVTFEPAPCTQ